MAAGQNDFCAEHATLFHWRIELKETTTGPAWDLTEAEPKMEVRDATCSDPPVLEFTVANGGVTNLALQQGTFDLYKSTDQMAAIEIGSYVYDLILVRESEVQRVLQGAFVVTPVVTQPDAAPAGRRTETDYARMGQS